MAKKQSIEVKQTVEASPEAVWTALTNIPVLTQWMCDAAEFQGAVGGAFFAWWNEGWYASGMVTEFQENEVLAYTWQGKDEPGESQVRVGLSGKNGSTTVSLTHETPEGEEWKSHLSGFESNWKALFENLKYTVEEGLDKRLFVDRPFLGILLNGLPDKPNAERLGLPEHGKWIHISGTMAGTGAEAAGLKSDDVMLKMDGKKTETFNDLTAIITTHKAGDTVTLEIFRDKQTVEVEMKLSHRPRPEVPHDKKELVAEVRKVNSEISAELAKLFEGVSEAEATARPGENEWSAREVLAQLLMNEHSSQHWIATTIMGGQRIPGYANEIGTIGAMAASYTDTKSLLAELERAMEVTACAMENMPDGAVARRYDYLALAQNALTGNPLHTRGHYPQIEAAIAAAGEGK
jgi:uncharacterized protein YndB with AHSA1/START domain